MKELQGKRCENNKIKRESKRIMMKEGRRKRERKRKWESKGRREER